MANPALTRSFKTAVANEQYRSDNTVAEPKMTLEGVINKVFIMFAVVIASATVVWLNIETLASSGLFYPAMFISMLGALGLGIWASVSKAVHKGAMIGYAALEGVFIGIFSGLLNTMYPGVVIQAVVATFATVGVIFSAWKFGWIKVTDRYMKFMMFALVGYLIFGLINFGIAMFTGSSVYNTGLGWVVALIGCGLAAMSLAADFQMINKGIEIGLPAENEWRGAYGLTVTIIWLYVEILRLLSIFNR